MLSVVEILKDPIALPAPQQWSLHSDFDADDPKWWVGSYSPCALVIAHPTVSRTQFLVRPSGDHFVLRNLGKYGTHVDGVHVTGDDEITLRAQSSIRAGAVYLRADVLEDSPFVGDDADADPWAVDELDVADVWGMNDQSPHPPKRDTQPKGSAPARHANNYVTDPGLRARPVAAQPKGSADPTMDRILAAAGIPAAYRERAAEVVRPEDIGQLLGAWVKGARSVQFVKREIKESHRLEATTTFDGSINPLRKAIPAEEILALLLGFEGPLYARGEDAVRQWFADLVQHEVAVPDAVKEAWIKHVASLAPGLIAERADATGIMGKVSRAHRLASQWQAFEDFYERELKDANLSFRRQFLPNFSEAYSEAIGRKAAPKKPKKAD